MAQELLEDGSFVDPTAAPSSSSSDNRPANNSPASEKQLCMIEGLMAGEAEALGDGMPSAFKAFVESNPTVTEAQRVVQELLSRQKVRKTSRRREVEVAKVVRRKRNSELPSDLL